MVSTYLTIRVAKTIQVRDYTPCRVEIELTGELEPNEDYVRTFRRTYRKLSQECDSALQCEFDRVNSGG